MLRTAALQDGKIQSGETHIFAGRGYVVTVRHGSTSAYKEVRARCESAPTMLAMGESFVVYSIMDFVVDRIFPSHSRTRGRGGRPGRCGVFTLRRSGENRADLCAAP
jgi:Mg2+ and Co2+ transporter CorA